jgi:hypothetical protein
MKATDTKTSASQPVKEAAPFFNKGAGQGFFKSAQPVVQAKLTVGEPGDKYEKEADSMADKVVQRKADGLLQACPCEEKLQKKPIFESEGEAVQKKSDGEGGHSNDLEKSLNSSKGSGAPLPSATREQMEAGLGADFSNVRIHDNAQSQAMSQDLHAQAFTHGNDIYFNSGKYSPDNLSGQHLLAHELTHTIQQGAAIRKKGLIQRAPKTPPIAVPEQAAGSPPQKAAFEREPLQEVYFGRPKTSPSDFYVFPATMTTFIGLAKFLFKAANSGQEDEDVLADPKSPLSVITQAFKDFNPDLRDPILSSWPVHIGELPMNFALTPAALYLLNSTPLFAPGTVSPEGDLQTMGVSSLHEFVERKAKLDVEVAIDGGKLLGLIKDMRSWHPFGSGPEPAIMELLRKYALERLTMRPQVYPNGGEYFDKILMVADRETIHIGHFDEVTDASSILFNHISDNYKGELQGYKNNYSMIYRGLQPLQELSVWNDLVKPGLLRIPGAISEEAACFIKSIPLDIAKDIGNKLDKVANDYMDAVLSDEKESNKMSLEIACGFGAAAFDLVGGLTKIKKVIDALETADEVYKAYKEVSKVVDNLPGVLDLLSNGDKFLDILFGLSEDSALTTVEAWIGQADVSGGAKPNANANGLEKFMHAIGELVEFIKRMLRPIFEIRRRFLSFIADAESRLASNPIVSKLILALKAGEKLSNLLKGDIPQNIIDALMPLLTGVQDWVGDKIKCLGGKLTDIIAGIRSRISGGITEFAMAKIADKFSEIKIVMAMPMIKAKVNNLISEKLIDPLLGKIGFDAITGKINELTDMVSKKVTDAVGYVVNNMEGFIRNKLKDVHLQLTSLDMIPPKLFEKMLQDLKNRVKGGQQAGGKEDDQMPVSKAELKANIAKIAASPITVGELISLRFRTEKRTQAVVIGIDKEFMYFQQGTLSKTKKDEKFKRALSLTAFADMAKKRQVIRITKEREYLATHRPVYGEHQEKDVWTFAFKKGNGTVKDPHTEVVLKWDPSKSRFDQWHMGHCPGKEYISMVDNVIEGAITYDEFVEEYQNPMNYWPESPTENMSHKHEKKAGGKSCP